MGRLSGIFVCCVIQCFSSPAVPNGVLHAKQPDSLIYYLELTGIVRDNYGNLSGADVNVFQDSVMIRSGKAGKNGKCNIKLLLDNRYTVVFSAPGFVSKKIQVNTKVPVSKRGKFKFLYTVTLFELIEGLDVTPLQNPVAIITFNSMMNCFDYDYNYTVLVNREMEKMYDAYYKEEARINQQEKRKIRKKI